MKKPKQSWLDWLISCDRDKALTLECCFKVYQYFEYKEAITRLIIKRTDWQSLSPNRKREYSRSINFKSKVINFDAGDSIFRDIEDE